MVRARSDHPTRLATAARRAGLAAFLRMGRDAVDAALVWCGRPPLRVRAEGFVIHGYLRHRSVLEGIAAGRYASLYRALYERALRPGMIVVDGGAYVGLYTLIASRRIGEGGIVLAFEPDPYNFRALVFNVERNGCTNVVPLQKALSNDVGRRPFYQSEGTMSSSLVKRKNIELRGPVEVEITTLDHELGDSAANGVLVKLDVEGSEVLALQGMSQTLQRTGSAVLLAEVNPAALRDAGFRPEDLFRALERLHFHVQFIDEARRILVPLTDAGATRKGNLFCRRDA